MKKNDFFDKLMSHVISGVHIPKVQVERAVNPILSMFIESTLNKYFERDSRFSGEFKLVSPEFPLKKDNNQSTNIDYLLVNETKKLLVFFELKTDCSSVDNEQILTYESYKRRIKQNSANQMLDDLTEIYTASKIKSKYKTVIDNFKNQIPTPELINNIIVFYLAPIPSVKKLQKNDKIDFLLSFSDLPDEIEHEFAEYWCILKRNLVLLDKHFSGIKRETNYSDPLAIIVQNIKNFIAEYPNHSKPVSVQLGITGGGTHPNYQVEFEDGNIRTFRFNGKAHHITQFNPQKLDEKILWNSLG